MLTKETIKELIPIVGLRLKFSTAFSQLSTNSHQLGNEETNAEFEEKQVTAKPVTTRNSFDSISERITVEHSKIFGRGKTGPSSLTDWQKAVNASALAIASEDLSLLYDRAALKLKAEESARSTYVFKKKAGSRSLFTTDPKSTKRQNIDSTERTERIDSLSSKIDEIKKHIATKQHLIHRANSIKDYFLCDKVQKEMSELLQEKERFEKELKILQKKDARSKCYHKSKERKHPSKSMVSDVPLPPKTVQSEDIRTMFFRKSGESLSPLEKSTTNEAEPTTFSDGCGTHDSPIDLCSGPAVETENITEPENQTLPLYAIETSDHSIGDQLEREAHNWIDETQDEEITQNSRDQNSLPNRETTGDVMCIEDESKEAHTDDSDINHQQICENQEPVATSHVCDKSAKEIQDKDNDSLSISSSDPFLD